MTLRPALAFVVVLGSFTGSMQPVLADERKHDRDAESKLAEHLKTVNRFSQPDGSYEIFFVEAKQLELSKAVIIIKNEDKSIKRVIRADMAIIDVLADGKTFLFVDHAYVISNDDNAEVRAQEWEITKPVLPKKK